MIGNIGIWSECRFTLEFDEEDVTVKIIEGVLDGNPVKDRMMFCSINMLPSILNWIGLSIEDIAEIMEGKI